ncbi:MAG: hypothetical protein HYZ53_29805 [Planctomycetes bacterium]|nr:hypothetical protein [Planctomycetota bacterium]
MKPILAFAVAAVVAASVPAAADIVHLKNGARLEGEVVEQGDTLLVKLRTGTTKIPRDKVDRIEKADLPWQVYADRRAGLEQAELSSASGPDAAGHFQLARYCKQHKLREEQIVELLIAVRARPDLPGLREELAESGLVEHAGRWMTYAAMMTEKGYVQHEGKWISSEERDAIEARNEATRTLRKLEAKARDLLHEYRDEKKREESRLALAALDREARLRPMIECIRDASVPLRTYVVDTLADQFGARAKACFFKVSLEDGVPALRQAALGHLKTFGAADFLPYYCYYLKNDTAFARLFAANALGALAGMGDPTAIYTLIYTLHKVRMEVRVQDARVGSIRSVPIGNVGGNSPVVELPQVDLLSVSTTIDVPAGAGAEIVRGAVVDALQQITGQRFGDDVDRWVEWWNREGKAAAAAAAAAKK